MRFIIASLLGSFIFISSGFGQEDMPIMLTNPSFEDFPKAGSPPSGWLDCGEPSETPADTQPGGFGVETQAFDGHSYLGLVVRENDTFEAVGQRLNGLLLKDKCYEFSLRIARSLIYESPTKSSDEIVNHVTPCKLRIWGGTGICGKKELLAETSLIINTRWLEYNFKFEPNFTHTYIMFEAFYKTPVLMPYNGNILLDNASPIFPIPCDTEEPEGEEVEEPIVDNTPITEVKKEPTPVIEEPAPEKIEAPIAEQPVQPKILEELDRTRLKAGQTIRIDKLYFGADQRVFSEESNDVLDEIFAFMNANADVVVEIGGHTNTIPEHDYCDKLSTERAKSVVDYLIQKGIKAERLTYKGYGKRNPLVYDKSNRAARKKNQRVEIKILSIDG